jgi:hypothetical protein
MMIRAASAARVALVAGAACASFALTSAANAAEHAIFLNAPAIGGLPAPRLAVQFQLKLRLPEGRGLARMLLDAGVSQNDAAAAARLAAGHLGAGSGGCQALVSVERDAQGGASSVVRVQLITDTRLTVIERRGTELTIASDTPTSDALRFV